MEVDLLHLEGGVPVLLVVGLLVVGSVVKGEGKVEVEEQECSTSEKN